MKENSTKRGTVLSNQNTRLKKPSRNRVTTTKTYNPTFGSSNGYLFSLKLQDEITKIVESQRSGKYPIFRRFSSKKKLRLIYSLTQTELTRINSLKENIRFSEFKDLLSDSYYRESLRESLRESEIVNGYRYKRANRG